MKNKFHDKLWKPHLVLLCFDSFRFSRENYYVLPSGMKYVLRLGACRCWEPNILCFAGDIRKDCQGMWINTCWCTLNSIPIWHARGIYQKETTSSKHFYKAEWIPYLAANWSLQNYNKCIDVTRKALFPSP